MRRLLDCLAPGGVSASALRSGKQAMKAEHADKVEAVAGYRIQFSVDLDTELRSAHPDENRWDYGLELAQKGRPERFEWVEAHSASSSDVETVIGKRDWLLSVLQKSGNSPCRPGSANLHWLAIGGVHIDNQRRRRLASAGLRMPQKYLRLPIS